MAGTTLLFEDAIEHAATGDLFLFRGRSVGADGITTGEVVFNTSMTGYQEVITDPSYAGQLVCMTYPHIGNYGVNEEDGEAEKPWIEPSATILTMPSRRRSVLKAASSRARSISSCGVMP